MWVGANMSDEAASALVEVVHGDHDNATYAAVLALGLADRQDELR